MSYTQTYPQYQKPSYHDQQQPYWNGVNFATTGSSQFQGDAGYYDSTIPANELNAGSPHFSQYVNFDAIDVESPSGPSEALSSPTFYTTSPVSDNLQQFTNFPVKIEPEYEQDFPSFSCGVSAPPYDEVSPRTCGTVPACLQLLENNEIEDFNLQGIAPPRKLSNVEKESPRKLLRSNSGSARPVRKASDDTGVSTKKPRGNRRGRKPSTSENDEAAQARAKQAHSIVERRYRDNLNGKIMQLHRTLSSIGSPARLASMSSTIEDASNGADNEQRSTRVRKSDVMTDAVNYVHQSEVSMRHMTDEIQRLTDRVKTLEKLVKCEDCVLLKEMVRLQLQSQQAQAQPGQQFLPS